MLWLFWLYGGFVGTLMFVVLLDTWFGLRKLSDLSLAEWDAWPRGKHPKVTVIVPALNEEKQIANCLRALIDQDYDELEIIAVDDRSTDSTGQIMDEVARSSGGRVRVLHVTELPPGWLGKTHAMWKAASLASGEWLLFTDGDAILRPDCVRRTIAFSEAKGADHFSLVPTLVARSVGEGMMLSVFWFSLSAVRPWKVPDRGSRHAMGAGAYNLVRRSVYRSIGTFEAIRLAVVEDMALAGRIKRAGFAPQTALATGFVNVHWAPGIAGIIRTFAKNGYAFIGFRWYLAAILVAVALALHVGPFAMVWLAPGITKLGFAVGLASLLARYFVVRPVTNLSPAYFLLHPVGGLLTSYAMLLSAVVTTWQGGVTWRGTKYSTDDLRRAAAQHPGLL